MRSRIPILIAVVAASIAGPTASVAHADVPPGPAPENMGWALEDMSGLWSEPRCVGDGVSGDRVGIVYVHAADEPSRLAAVAPWMQVAARATTGIVEHSSGGRRTLRWLQDSSCQPRIIEAVAPRQVMGTWDGVVESLPATKRLKTRHRAWLVYVDGDSNARWVAGQGGARFAVVWRAGWADADAHELVHAIGGISDGAPHATGKGHCNDGLDLMCYDDGGPAAAQAEVCPGEFDPWLMDCGGDDYFNVDPVPGSWLAAHPRANLANSPFLHVTDPLALPEATPAPTGLVASRGGDGLLRVSWTTPTNVPVTVMGWTRDGSLVTVASGLTCGESPNPTRTTCSSWGSAPSGRPATRR